MSELDMPLTTEEIADLASDLPAPTLGAQHALPDHTAEDGFDELCLRVIQQCIEDIHNPRWRIREQAIWDIQCGRLELWLWWLPVGDEARGRVRQLLLDLARCARLPR